MFVAAVAAVAGQGSYTLSAGIPATSPAAVDAAALRHRGQALGYNLDRDAALAAFREAMAADPTDPAAYRLTAAALWIGALFEQGAVTAEDYLGQARSDANRQAASAAGSSRSSASTSIARWRSPKSAAARRAAPTHIFSLAPPTAIRQRTPRRSRAASFGSLRAARRAYAEHERVLELDPSRKDAGLIVGMYRYGDF